MNKLPFVVIILAVLLCVILSPRVEANKEEVVIYQLYDKYATTSLVEPNLIGMASWYDYKLDGIEWSKNHATCASRTLKRYSTVRVVNIENGKSVDCYVNDYVENPNVVIDLSSYAFNKIASLKKGLIKVKIYEQF